MHFWPQERVAFRLVHSVVLVLASISFCSRGAKAFPEFTRHKYQSCVTCHVAPSGGGALTAYGRMISKSLLSTLKGCDKCRPAVPEWVDFGADYRFLNANYFPDGAPSRHAKFPMQIEGEAVVHPVKGLSAAATIGTYGPFQEQEYRRNYVMVTVADLVRARGGRFIPAYGVNDPDHTLWPRRALNLGQGHDQIAAELSVITRYGELIATHAFGETFATRADTGGYSVERHEAQRTYARLAAYVAQTSQVGLSGRFNASGRLDAGAATAFASWRQYVYGITEAGYMDTPRGHAPVTYVKIGTEPLRGIHFFVTHEHANDDNRFGAGSQWFVTQGVEVLGVVRRVLKQKATEASLVLHAYL
jgi:hypothetical protein